MVEFKEESLRLSGFYRAEVLDNGDPLKLGRVKINVFNRFGGIDKKHLPWAVPAVPMFAGAGSGFGYFAVPEVGSCVWCFFEAEDVYQPVYFAEAPDGVHGLPSERTTNYPSRKVWKTKRGIKIIIDDSNGNITIDAMEAGGNVVIKGTTVNINP